MTVTYDASRVTLVDHPLVQHKLSILRDKSTGTNQFRQLVRELALFDGYEAMRDLPMEDVEVETPITTATFKQLTGKKLAIVPILRAGLGMVDGILDLVPSARVGHIGMERDEVTHEPHEYYCKMPRDIDQRICLVVDPMLATGGSAEMAIGYLRERGVKDIRMLCIVAAPEGLKSLTEKDPDVQSIPAPLTTTSTRPPTSSPAWAMPATASTARCSLWAKPANVENTKKRCARTNKRRPRSPLLTDVSPRRVRKNALPYLRHKEGLKKTNRCVLTDAFSVVL